YSHTSNGTDNDNSEINVDSKNWFFNPKIGITNKANEKIDLYASLSIANREPIRSDFIDSKTTPQHETLYDLELGKNFNYKRGQLNTNFFWMEYDNQLITTGEINDVGANIRKNVKKSRRYGIELSNVIITQMININSSLTLSKNYVFNFNEYIYDYGSDFSEFNTIINKYKKTDISFSPNIIFNNSISWRFTKQFSLTFKSKYVGKQFLDNTSNSQRSIDSFLVNDLEFSTSFNKNIFKNLYLKFSINNIFNEMYSSNGYTFGYYGGLEYEVRENYYYPQAGRNYIFTINIKF
ncbi:MAG: TonB-dependent receptor, partial [Bacteroidota bacterium]|nr:TonB-dependent receptor [Bacteroidota bacterium]